MAGLLLGRALSGFGTPALPASTLARGLNMRRGAALLLRAADEGLTAAWMVLYHIHSDHHTSVSNPLMARFFLEKAALAGELTNERHWRAAKVERAAPSDLLATWPPGPLFDNREGIDDRVTT